METQGECERCAHLRQTLPIVLPDDLRRVIRRAKANVENGTLTVVEAESLPGAQPFAQLSPSGQWDDVVHFVFVCKACGQPFELSAETYHGAGGVWCPL